MDRRVTSRLGAACGFAGIAGNVLGVLVLGPIPAAYRVDTLEAWTRQVLATPGAAAASSVAFTLGLLALAGWILILGARLDAPLARAGAWLAAAGAVVNAAGTTTPLVLAWHLGPVCADVDACLPAGVALLGFTLALDALFNLLLGLGLLGLASPLLARERSPRWPGVLALAAGLASIPVSLQVVAPFGATLLAVAGPLWLATMLVTSVLLWRNRL